MNNTALTEFAISVNGLQKHYGDIKAVNGLDLSLRRGEFFGLLGPNGSGKTTTINTLATLIRPSAGQVHVAGYDVLHDPIRVRGCIGLVFQDSALDRTLSIGENLRFAGMLHNLSDAQIAARSVELLTLFGMEDMSTRSVASLSGGQRRAVDIARGVIHHPRILFLDEPTIGLDLPTRRRIWRFIEELRVNHGMTVLLTTHYLEEAEDCDRVAFIKAGKIVQTGAPHALINALGHHIIDIEADDLPAVAQAVSARLGHYLLDGNTASFRVDSDDRTLIASVQSEFDDRLSAMRVRKPNLNDVFLWINEKKLEART
jgi:ABC-2 type transport system ATP-binding protein